MVFPAKSVIKSTFRFRHSSCGSHMNEKHLISGTPDVLPEGVEYPPVVPDSKHAIGRGDPVGVGLLRVAEEGVRDPDLPDHVAVEAQDLHRAVEF